MENKGKQICNYLKEVRRRVAEENDIRLEQHECTFKGECSGTCPRCEAEVRHIEAELKRRSQLGKAAMVAGLAVATAAFVSCTEAQLMGEYDFPTDTVVDTTATVPQDTINPIE